MNARSEIYSSRQEQRQQDSFSSFFSLSLSKQRMNIEAQLFQQTTREKQMLR